jgi:hypothetical protein
MALGSIPIDRTKALGAELYDAIRSIQTGIARLVSLQAIMVQQIDTVPNPDDFSALETQFGFAAGLGDDAKAELDSLLSKFTTDASVSSVLAARNQAAAKFGVV